MNNVAIETPTAPRNRRAGMTLIEILMVLALLGLVLSIIGKSVFSSFSKGKVNAARIQIKQLEGDLDRYRLDCNKYPSTQEGLKALMENPGSCKDWDTQKYTKNIKDPWGAEFVYTCDDGLNYKITSLGADGKEGGEGEAGDISSSDE